MPKQSDGLGTLSITDDNYQLAFDISVSGSTTSPVVLAKYSGVNFEWKSALPEAPAPPVGARKLRDVLLKADARMSVIDMQLTDTRLTADDRSKWTNQKHQLELDIAYAKRLSNVFERLKLNGNRDYYVYFLVKGRRVAVASTTAEADGTEPKQQVSNR